MKNSQSKILEIKKVVCELQIYNKKNKHIDNKFLKTEDLERC